MQGKLIVFSMYENQHWWSCTGRRGNVGTIRWVYGLVESKTCRFNMIEDGKLIEDGTHESLLEKNGVYAAMWKRQLRHQEA